MFPSNAGWLESTTSLLRVLLQNFNYIYMISAYLEFGTNAYTSCSYQTAYVMFERTYYKSKIVKLQYLPENNNFYLLVLLSLTIYWAYINLGNGHSLVQMKFHPQSSLPNSLYVKACK